MTSPRPLGQRRLHHSAFSAEVLAAVKNGTTGGSVVDETIVIDDHSTDAAAAAAANAGSAVLRVPRTARSESGKGVAMVTAVAQSTGYVIVFCDADVENFASHFVVGLLGEVRGSRPRRTGSHDQRGHMGDGTIGGPTRRAGGTMAGGWSGARERETRPSGLSHRRRPGPRIG